MSTSTFRAELEAMDRDELIEHMKDQSQEIDRLETLVIRSLDRGKDLEDRVEELEAETERLRARTADTNEKQDKIEAIIQFANNKRTNDQPAVYVTPKEMKGAAGISLRYAYDLVDELPDEYNWALTPSQMTDYGEVELDRSKQERKVAIDFEGVQSGGVPLNLFNNSNEGDRHE